MVNKVAHAVNAAIQVGSFMCEPLSRLILDSVTSVAVDRFTELRSITSSGSSIISQLQAEKMVANADRVNG